jgi:hypothetical protein
VQQPTDDGRFLRRRDEHPDAERRPAKRRWWAERRAIRRPIRRPERWFIGRRLLQRWLIGRRFIGRRFIGRRFVRRWFVRRGVVGRRDSEQRRHARRWRLFGRWLFGRWLVERWFVGLPGRFQWRRLLRRRFVGRFLRCGHTEQRRDARWCLWEWRLARRRLARRRLPSRLRNRLRISSRLRKRRRLLRCGDAEQRRHAGGWVRVR